MKRSKKVTRTTKIECLNLGTEMTPKETNKAK
jgi:hypothetical protein